MESGRSSCYPSRRESPVCLFPLQLYRNGQRLLEKQRFQFPPSWLYIDNIEGEWGAFNDIMRRKDSAIQQQVANLQMKIVQEDRAVESRTTDLLTDWEKTKPVTVSPGAAPRSPRTSSVLCVPAFRLGHLAAAALPRVKVLPSCN